MLKFKTATVVLASVLLAIGTSIAVTTPARAMNITPAFKSSYGDVLGACIKVKGVWSEDAGGYGCTKPNCDGKGGNCTVGCTNDDVCHGATPSRIVGQLHLRGLLQDGSLVNHFYETEELAPKRHSNGNVGTPGTPSLL